MACTPATIRRTASLVVLLSVLVLPAACAGAGSPSPGASEAASPTPAANESAEASETAETSATAAATMIEVTLKEWAIVPAQASAPAGTVTFSVTNDGPADPHELVVVKTDLGHRDLPTGEDGGVEETGEGIDLIGEIEEFEPGTTQSADFDLEAGKYVLLCNLVEEEEGQLESHYQMGMSVEFTVE